MLTSGAADSAALLCYKEFVNQSSELAVLLCLVNDNAWDGLRIVTF